MRTTDNLLFAALAALGQHRVLIQETYLRGTVLRTPENARELFVLLQHRILVTEGHDRYRLSASLRRFFDSITQRQRLYELLGDGIGALNDRVHKLKDEFHHASMEGRLDDMDSISGQFYDACAELSDTVASGISTLLLQAESNFAAVNSLAAKQRQNAHYVAEAQKMDDALGALARINMQDLLDTSPVYQPLAGPYRRLITDRLPEWNVESMRVTSILKEYLFRLRVIEPDTRLIRGFAKFLRQNPGYTPPDLDEASRPPPWLLRDPGVSLVSYSNPLDMDTLPELEAIARTLPAATVTTRQERQSGVLAPHKEAMRTESQAEPAYRIALGVMGQAALKAPVSSLEWFRQNGQHLGMPEDVWLLLVLHSQSYVRWPFSRLTYERIEQRGASALSRNLLLRDVHLHGS